MSQRSAAARAAVSITRATARGSEMYTTWLPWRTVTFDPARLAVRRAIAPSGNNEHTMPSLQLGVQER